MTSLFFCAVSDVASPPCRVRACLGCLTLSLLHHVGAGLFCPPLLTAPSASTGVTLASQWKSGFDDSEAETDHEAAEQGLQSPDHKRRVSSDRVHRARRCTAPLATHYGYWRDSAGLTLPLPPRADFCFSLSNDISPPK